MLPDPDVEGNRGGITRRGSRENVECSNRGQCDRGTGICSCYTNFACECHSDRARHRVVPCFLTCPPYSCSKQWRWIGCSCSGWGPLGLRLQLGGLVCLFLYAAAVGLVVLVGLAACSEVTPCFVCTPQSISLGGRRWWRWRLWCMFWPRNVLWCPTVPVYMRQWFLWRRLRVQYVVPACTTCITLLLLT